MFMRFFYFLKVMVFLGFSLSFNVGCGSSSTGNSVDNPSESPIPPQDGGSGNSNPTNPVLGAINVFDLNSDGIVGFADYEILYAAMAVFNSNADFNDDGIVDGADLTLLLAAWTEESQPGPIQPNPDFNNDGALTGADIGIFMSYMNTNEASADFNEDGIVDSADLTIMLSFF